MAVTPTVSIRQSLSLATATLLTGANSHAAVSEDSNTKYDVYYLDYSEKGRVHVQAPVFAVTRSLSDTKSVEYKLVLDSMSGATPNGATPTDSIQTFSGVSGGGGYTTPANETPTRDFSEKRIALSIAWQEILSSYKRNTFAFNISTESDYTSLGISSAYSLGVNKKLTTLSWGFGLASDFISPNGGKPDPLSEVNTDPNAIAPLEEENEEEHEDDEFPEVKVTADLLLGVTQIISRNIITQFNYSHATIHGYITDPYKVVSIVNTDGTPAKVLNTDINRYLYEARPDTRNINSLFWKTLIHLQENILRLSYRYFWDDWGITSKTIDIKFRYQMGWGLYMQPHYRLARQSAADFYRHSIFSNEASTISHVSADYRLSAFQSETIGIKIAKELRAAGHIGLRFEKMIQTGKSHPDDAVGPQRQYNLFPQIEATIVQFSFSQRF